MNLKVFINWQLDPLERFLDEVPQFIDSQREIHAQDRLNKDGLSSEQLYESVYSVALNAVLHEMNSAVDFILLSIANRVLPENERLTFSSMSRSRQRSIIEIEKQYRCSLDSLEGWSSVEQVREQSNSLKHRGGLNLPREVLGLPYLTSVKLTREGMKVCLGNVRRWLYAVSELTS